METQRSKWLYCRNADDGVLIPTPLLIGVLMGLLAMAGLAQGSSAWLESGVSISNAIIITFIPIFGGIVTLFVFLPAGIHYEIKSKKSSSMLSVCCIAALASSFASATIVGFPLLFVWSKSLGLPFHGLCDAFLILHWYHFLLAGVVGICGTFSIFFSWARRSTKVSKPANVVLQLR